MARKPQVTRTIKTTHAVVLCVNTEDRSTFEQTITLPRTYTDDKKLMKIIEGCFDEPDSPVKPISVISTEVKETLYGMTEEEFIQYAHVLPPRK